MSCRSPGSPEALLMPSIIKLRVHDGSLLVLSFYQDAEARGSLFGSLIPNTREELGNSFTGEGQYFMDSAEGDMDSHTVASWKEQMLPVCMITGNPMKAQQ